MDLLLDTHILLWWLNDDEKLTDTHCELISDSENICNISSATIWEISIKSGIGKLEIPQGYIRQLEKEGFQSLPVSWEHADKVRTLPRIHKDPFDRLLIAQAQIERIILLTVDENIRKYEVKTI